MAIDTIPQIITLPVEGCDDLIFYKDDMTSLEAWFQLSIDNDMNLQPEDFVDDDKYMRYFFMASGLMSYACAFLIGPEGQGKSLGLNYLTYQMLRLFPEKRGTYDFSAPKRNVFLTDLGKTYEAKDSVVGEVLGYIKMNQGEGGVPLHFLCGDLELGLRAGKQLVDDLKLNGLVTLDTVPEFKRCDRIKDKDVVKRLQEDINKTAEFEEDIPPDLLESLLVYNRIFGMDEIDKWADKSNRTNYTKLFGRLIVRRRHYHTTFLMATVDSNSIDRRLLWDRRTHIITCDKIEGGICRYQILHKRTGKTHWMYLDPSRWLHIWDSWNMSAVSHDVEVKLSGGKKKKNPDEEETNG
jgi:hypothetical protein